MTPYITPKQFNRFIEAVSRHPECYERVMNELQRGRYDVKDRDQAERQFEEAFELGKRLERETDLDSPATAESIRRGRELMKAFRHYAARYEDRAA